MHSPAFEHFTAMLESESANLAQLRSLASSSGNNSTCYWAIDKITEKDSSNIPFFLYFLVAFGAIRAYKILVDLKQLRLYKTARCPPEIAEHFNAEEF